LKLPSVRRGARLRINVWVLGLWSWAFESSVRYRGLERG
jgi:hypothetical protein